MKASRVVRDAYASENALIVYSIGEKFGIKNTHQKKKKKNSCDCCFFDIKMGRAYEKGKF